MENFVYLVKDGKVYRERTFPNGAKEVSLWGELVKVKLTGPSGITISTPATLRAEYYDWQGNSIPDENRPIRVRVGEDEMLVQPVDGVAELDVQVDYVPEGGTLVIEAVGDGFGCDPGRLEVTVVE